MTTRTLAFSFIALIAPVLAADAFAQRPPPPRAPGNQPGYDRADTRMSPDRARVERYEYERTRERERLAGLAFREGYEAGLNAGRERRPFEVSRESRYRSADRRYERDFGPREIYRSFYRDAFGNGYERGYREAGYRDRRGVPDIWWRW